MKIRLSLLILLSIIAFSCSEDDENNNDPQNDPIVGEWQLNSKYRPSWGGESITNYSPGDVTYRFNTDGTVNILSTIPEISNETLNYEIINDCIISPGCLNGDTPYNILIMNNDSRNTFGFFNEDTELIFGEGWRDWWDYYLERIP